MSKTVKCIESFGVYLTLGKQYVVLSEDDKYYKINDDDNCVAWYHKSRFSQEKPDCNKKEEYKGVKQEPTTFDYGKANSYLDAAIELQDIDTELEATILMKLSKLIKDYNNG